VDHFENLYFSQIRRRIRMNWHDTKRDAPFREQFFSRMEHIFRVAYGARGETPSSINHSRQSNVTNALEELCYNQASSLQEYSDPSYMPIMLHRISAQKAKRRVESIPKTKPQASKQPSSPECIQKLTCNLKRPFSAVSLKNEEAQDDFLQDWLLTDYSFHSFGDSEKAAELDRSHENLDALEGLQTGKRVKYELYSSATA